MLIPHLDAYFVGRNQILSWLNTTFAAGYSRIEECGTGAIQCQIVEALYPNSIPMAKVNFGAKQEYEFIENFKLIQAAFEKLNIAKVVPIQQLVKAKYQVHARSTSRTISPIPTFSHSSTSPSSLIIDCF